MNGTLHSFSNARGKPKNQSFEKSFQHFSLTERQGNGRHLTHLATSRAISERPESGQQNAVIQEDGGVGVFLGIGCGGACNRRYLRLDFVNL